MKSKLLYILLFVFAACDDFGDMNVDANNPTKVPVAGFLTNAIHGMAPAEQELTGLFYSQYWSQTRYTSESRYSVSQFDFTTYYSGVLRDLNEVIRLNSDPATSAFAAESGSNNNQIAVARIVKAYYFHFITDRWGDIPLADALKASEGVITPSYEKQEDVYTKLFSELKEAVAQFDSGPAPAGDVLYHGEIDKWKKFANSLRLKMALRLSNINPTLAENEFADAYNDGVLQSNDDNATYDFLGDGNFNNPAFNFYSGGRIDYAISNTLIDFLKQRNDPRIVAFADPTENTLPQNEYLGMPYGLTEGQAGAFAYDSVSLPNSTMVRGKDSPGFILTYAQVLFSLAEASEKGWITADTRQLYEDAIKASFEQWGVFDLDDYNDYIAHPDVAFSAADAQQLILEQKWVALFMQGYEAWAEWRRTGYPNLLPAPAAVNNSGQIPRRQGYPASEAANNANHYKLAVERQGPDLLETNLWWDN